LAYKAIGEREKQRKEDVVNQMKAMRNDLDDDIGNNNDNNNNDKNDENNKSGAPTGDSVVY